MKKLLVLIAAAAIILSGCKKHVQPDSTDSNTAQNTDKGGNGGEGGGGNGGGNGGGGGAQDIAEPAANCIVVRDANVHYIDVTKHDAVPQGLTEQDLNLHLRNDLDNAKLIWESKHGWITELSIDKDKKCIVFKTDGTPGNALVASYNSYNLLTWSWHIWNPGEGNDPKDLNLGAISAEDSKAPQCYGLLYQWGRKEPMPGGGTSNSISGSTDKSSYLSQFYDPEGNRIYPVASGFTNTIANTPVGCIQNPTRYMVSYWLSDAAKNNGDYIDNENGYDDLWGYNSNKKTCLDPCPAGYRVPGNSMQFAALGLSGVTITDKSFGKSFKYGDLEVYLPYGSFWSGSQGDFTLNLLGLVGIYWTAQPDSRKSTVFMLTKSSTPLLPAQGRADACSVRCIPEE